MRREMLGFAGPGPLAMVTFGAAKGQIAGGH